MRADSARPTQIIMYSFASRSSSVSSESRWSGVPDSTAVSQVPHTPSRHEESTLIPFSSSASMIDLSGGTVTVTPERATTTSNAESPPPRRLGCGLAANRSR